MLDELQLFILLHSTVKITHVAYHRLGLCAPNFEHSEGWLAGWLIHCDGLSPQAPYGLALRCCKNQHSSIDWSSGDLIYVSAEDQVHHIRIICREVDLQFISKGS